MVLVIDPFEVILPVSVFVNLIEGDERSGRVLANELLEEEGIFEKTRPVLRDIPVEIQAVREGCGNDLRKSGLADLAGADEEDHALFTGQVLPGLYIKISCFHG